MGIHGDQQAKLPLTPLQADLGWRQWNQRLLLLLLLPAALLPLPLPVLTSTPLDQAL